MGYNGDTERSKRVGQRPGSGEGVHGEAMALHVVESGQSEQETFCAADMEAVDQVVNNQALVHGGGLTSPGSAIH